MVWRKSTTYFFSRKMRQLFFAGYLQFFCRVDTQIERNSLSSLSYKNSLKFSLIFYLEHILFGSVLSCFVLSCQNVELIFKLSVTIKGNTHRLSLYLKITLHCFFHKRRLISRFYDQNIHKGVLFE